MSYYPFNTTVSSSGSSGSHPYVFYTGQTASNNAVNTTNDLQPALWRLSAENDVLKQQVAALDAAVKKLEQRLNDLQSDGSTSLACP